MSLRQHNKRKIEAAILNAAAELIAEHGVHATTTRQIAKRAGISYQTLYNYFPTKGEMLRALLADELLLWQQQVDTYIKHYQGDLFATLETIHRHAAEIVRGEQQALWQALYTSSLNAGDSDSTALLGVTHERYHALLAIAQGTGQLQANADLHLLAHTLYCLNDYAMLMLSIKQRDADAILHTLDEQARLILSGALTTSA